ncbi:ATP-binding protein [Streptomyces sp. C184]|uniref:ATP-binding protein n=1 Tax=Streptomyces sp. C184 TaxID=3237121 RepID=UPI0034C609C9
MAHRAAALNRRGHRNPHTPRIRRHDRPRREERILANLLTNAHRHGAPPVTLDVDGTTLHVRDHGPGFPTDLLTHGPQRFRTPRLHPRHRPRSHHRHRPGPRTERRVTYENPPGGGALATLRLREGVG